MKIFTLFAIFLVFEYVGAAFVVPPAPVGGYILDELSLLTSAQKQQLQDNITMLESETKHQVGIAIVKSLQGRPVEEASLAIARTWGIGQKGFDNGILILIAPNEREMRIEVGRGLEGVMTDLMANRVINEYLTPAFSREAYFEGLESAIDVIMPVLRGEVVDIPVPPQDPVSVLISLIFFLIWGGMFLGSAVFEPSKAWWPGIVLGALLGGLVMWFLVGTLTTALVGGVLASGILGMFDWLFSTGKIRSVRSRPHGGRWGGGGWGSGGGGFGGGFGGGGFGGGGASGRW